MTLDSKQAVNVQRVCAYPLRDVDKQLEEFSSMISFCTTKVDKICNIPT